MVRQHDMRSHHLTKSIIHTAVEGEGVMANRILDSRFPTLVAYLHIHARSEGRTTIR